MVWNNGKLNPQEAKAWGLRQTLMWLLTLSFTQVAIELDNKSMVDDISSKLGHKSKFGAILSACKNHKSELGVIPSASGNLLRIWCSKCLQEY